MNDLTAIELSGVGLIYHEPTRETRAVEGLDLCVRRGEFVSIVGPSGCGKTSVLSIIAGLFEPSAGRVSVLGTTPEKARSRVGYMLQRDELLEWRTIEKNALLGLEVRGELTPETRGKTVELLERFGLGSFKKAHPSALSGGMRQRAALVRTLALKPELLLLDEPFSALDYQTRLILEDEVRTAIKQEGCTALLVTHDISEAIAMSDRIAVFSGRPARVQKEFAADIPGSAFERRSDKYFSVLFNNIWEELKA